MAPAQKSRGLRMPTSWYREGGAPASRFPSSVELGAGRFDRLSPAFHLLLDEVRELGLGHLSHRQAEVVEPADECRVVERCLDRGMQFRQHGGGKLHAAIQTSLRSEEHTSELQSLRHLVCRLLLEKKNYIEVEQ